MKKYKVFIACDTKKTSIVKKIIRETKNKNFNIGYKFGLEFLNSKNGRDFILSIKDEVTFGDYKISDIPNTCKSAIRAIKDLNFNYITIHINCGLNALKAAKKVVGKTKLVGVSILTSLDNKSLKEIGYDKNLEKIIECQAKLASKANLDAMVCSAREVKKARKYFKKEIITPGIRFNNNKDDQKRILTPKNAYKNGSDWIVIGRPVTKGNIKKNVQKLLNNLR